ncbi:MAG: hypothetical protein DMF12_10885 [Verrucomicrobia bacterium]|nr:MAG: hypothetical protein DMF12_10885 [Verrucomicrobiota bacterium]
MNLMTSPTIETVDLLDLKLLPAWVKEPAEARSYAHYSGEGDTGRRKAGHGPQRGKPKRRTPINREQASNIQRQTRKADRPHREASRNKTGSTTRRWHGAKHRPSPNRDAPVMRTPPVTIRFLPYLPAFENVAAQIQSGSVAYSLFALARLFLEKPVGYEVCVTAKAESPFYQLGDNGAVSVDREFLERNAFRFAQRDFYQVDVVETDPVKGNFSNVARCRLSGTLLGPTNHHNYQPQLRSLYDQRFSRRMSFADYERQIEIVSDAALIDRWKEEARKVTTYNTLREKTPVTFSSPVEAERHFRSNYMPGLIRSMNEVTIGGASSRRLPDRTLNRVIEEAWARETRSPSNMMQELASRFRQNGLQVFRHRRGMLFVSPIRVRAFVHEQAGVSPSVNAILETLSGAPGINRKQLFEKLLGASAMEDTEPSRLALASDLRWLINVGYVIEFNDGSLDLPRGKSKPSQVLAAAEAGASSSNESGSEPFDWLWAKPPLQLTWQRP